MKGPLDEAKAMELFECKLKSTQQDLGPIIRSILPYDTLGNWCEMIQGADTTADTAGLPDKLVRPWNKS
jgi:hypothetical protein